MVVVGMAAPEPVVAVVQTVRKGCLMMPVMAVAVVPVKPVESVEMAAAAAVAHPIACSVLAQLPIPCLKPL